LKVTCKSRAGVRLGTLPMVLSTLFCRRCNFKWWRLLQMPRRGRCKQPLRI
jgi:hypothetical protein